MSEDRQVQEVIEQLAILEPTEAEAPRLARLAFARLQAELSPPQRPSWLVRLRQARLGQQLLAPQRRLATAVSLAVVLLVVSFSFPAVRAAASDFLGLFRVEKFAAIEITPEQMAILRQVAEQDIMPGELEVDKEPGLLTPVDSLSKAATVTGLTAVYTIPALGEPREIFVASGGNGHFTINEANTRRLLEAANLNPDLLPDGIDGARIRVATFGGVEQRWADGTTLLQTNSPEVQYPEALDPALMGEALLQILGLSAPEARRLASQIDWTSTLLLPIPSNIASFEELTVNGVSAIGLTSIDGRFHALIWQESGRLYLLIGAQSTAELAELANGLE